ncbi:hypothetical protein V8C35DRAFT_313274 [Trichoderma chlorosporum]
MKIAKVSFLARLFATALFVSNQHNTGEKLESRDNINCPSKNIIAFASAFTEYIGAWLTYCSYGYGPYIDAGTTKTMLYIMLNTCWNQQQQRSNAAEAGEYIINTRPTLAGYL